MVEWLKHMMVGDFIVLGVIYASLWFLYKNFLRKVMDKIEGKTNIKDCLALRLICQQGQIDRRKDGADLGDIKLGGIAEKLDIIMERQIQLIDRIDNHINGGHK